MAHNQSQVLVEMLGGSALKLSEMTARAETAEEQLVSARQEIDKLKKLKTPKPVEVPNG